MKMLMAFVLLSVSANAHASDLPFSQVKALLGEYLHVTNGEGDVALGSECTLHFEFLSAYSVNLKITSVDGSRSLMYPISSYGESIQSYGDGFEVAYPAGLDCETQGCLSYEDLHFRLTSDELFLEDLSPYDPLIYTTVYSMTCPLN